MEILYVYFLIYPLISEGSLPGSRQDFRLVLAMTSDRIPHCLWRLQAGYTKEMTMSHICFYR